MFENIDRRFEFVVSRFVGREGLVMLCVWKIVRNVGLVKVNVEKGRFWKEDRVFKLLKR